MAETSGSAACLNQNHLISNCGPKPIIGPNSKNEELNIFDATTAQNFMNPKTNLNQNFLHYCA